MAERILEQNESWIKDVRIPFETKSYTPVSHGDIIDALQENLFEKGIIPIKKKYISANNGQQIVGSWILGKQGEETSEKFNVGDQALAINFKNSYDKKLRLEIVPSVATCICSNQAMSKSSIAIFNRKHTGDVNLEFPIFVQNSLENLDSMFNMFQETFSKLREIKINKKLMASLAGEMYINENILSSEQMSVLKREILNSTFPQFNVEDAYSFYQHVTWSLQYSHPSHMIEKYTQAHDFIINTFNLNEYSTNNS